MHLASRALALSALLVATTSAPAAPPQGQGTAWDIVADLTTEIGPRLAGSEREAAARDWAVARLTRLGFQNVRIEPFTIDGWVRGEERARLLAPFPHQLAVTALGYSGPTPPEGIEGELVYFPSLDALRAAPDGSLAGKIAFIDHTMRASRDGADYGPQGNARRRGPSVAASKGAIATVIRSIGTDWHRNPHTGGTSWDKGVSPIPAGAVSNPDADMIARIAARGQPLRIALTLTGHAKSGLPSGNVVAELPGRNRRLPPILVACHLDSWDLGSGVIDDGAGCAIITAAALAAQQGGRPLRTIRVLWAGSEEIGVFGGLAYARDHAKEAHALAMESDFGADRVWQIKFRFAAANKPLADRIAAALGPLGIGVSAERADGGADIGALAELQKLAVIDLDQDGTRYFDLHHTPDDTLDKIDPAQLQQNVDAWAAVLRIVANEPGPISAN
jgi:hypothetical protein